MAKRKYKSKLAKILESHDNNTYETTFEDCKKWFNILNRELFDNKLPQVDVIDIRWRRGTLAYYVSQLDDKDLTYKHSLLAMNKKYKSKKFFVEVLAHEMVHHWQFVNDLPTNHGETFQVWNEKLKKRGIKI